MYHVPKEGRCRNEAYFIAGLWIGWKDGRDLEGEGGGEDVTGENYLTCRLAISTR